MRIYLYLLSGITSGLIGWNIAQIFLYEFGLEGLKMPEIVMFPCVASAMAIGMIAHEIFISNPTRITLCWRKLLSPLLIGLGLGTGLGLLAGIAAQILFLPVFKIGASNVRTFGWLIIGMAVGLAEGTSWRWQTIEAGNKKRFWQRFWSSVIGSSGSSMIAALIFEKMRYSVFQDIDLETLKTLRPYEDPIGFCILGLCLGVVFCITNSPSYLAALRAGKGFEYQDPRPQVTPSIKKPLLILSDSEQNDIEEGLSIQIPDQGKITIGSHNDDHIYLPEVPNKVATLKFNGHKVILIPNPKCYNFIAIDRHPLNDRQSRPLKHNQLITFYTGTLPNNINYNKFYRFVYYNRFLDPQS